MKSSGSRQNSETRTEPFPKPRPQPIFPKRVGLHVPHTYNRRNAHHISGPCSYSAACAFQLWASIVFPTSLRASYTVFSHSSVCFHTLLSVHRALHYAGYNEISEIPHPFFFNDCCMQGQNTKLLVNSATSEGLIITSREAIFWVIFFLHLYLSFFLLWHYFSWKALKEHVK